MRRLVTASVAVPGAANDDADGERGYLSTIRDSTTPHLARILESILQARPVGLYETVPAR
jgi:hypothetical protein